MSLSTPTRTTPPEISARAGPNAAHVAASATTQFKPFIRCPLRWLRCRSLPGAMVSSRKSALPFRQPQHQTVELRRDLDLARQPAVGPTLAGGAIEQRILVISNRRQPADPCVIHVDMAGGAQGA